MFFRKYLSEMVRDSSRGPAIVPDMFTINDFFYKVAGIPPTGRVVLLLELYEVYRRLNPRAEPLDDFVFWGDVILGDFDDADKYLVDARQLFTNVAELKDIQDSFSYLSETQRRALEAFVSHFRNRIGNGLPEPEIKRNFLQIWNILYPMYEAFNNILSEKGMAYEGMVYRRLAESLAREPVSSVLGGVFGENVSFVFVGLNALNECEKKVMGKMRDAGRAEFCWDYCGEMIRDRRNKSSFFMSGNLTDFPQSFALDDGDGREPENGGRAAGKAAKFHVVSVPSAVGQVKQVPRILETFAGGLPEDTAIVLPDENLLTPLLNSVPPEIEDINVTMGYPMKGSEFYSLMSDLAAMQLHSIERKGKRYFYHKQVWDVFASGIFRKTADEKSLEKMAGIKKAAKYYICEDDLKGTGLFDSLFVPAVEDLKSASGKQIKRIIAYQTEAVKTLASGMLKCGGMALELAFAKEYLMSLNILKTLELNIMPSTYLRLLEQILAGMTVPFKGEPLKGLQIMGPLETRALDFKNVIILSANEGVFPRRNVSSSFIPPELRRGFGLPTYEYQDAVWAYYFYRMISRAENVWLLCDSRAEGLRSGEETRYIRQLQYHFRADLKRYVVKSGRLGEDSVPEIVKTAGHVEKMRDMVFSATSVQVYLACPAKFYYSFIEELKTEDEVAESLDYGTFGTVYHSAMHALYSKGMEEAGGAVSLEFLTTWIKRGSEIKAIVRELIMSELNLMEIAGRNLVVSDVITRYVLKTMQRDLEILEKYGSGAFRILGLEIPVRGELCGRKFKGFIDRLDSLRPGQTRIVDYKTGKVLEEDESINDENAAGIAEAVFAPDVKARPKIALQFYLYDMLAHQNGLAEGSLLVNSVYSTSRLFRDAPAEVPENRVFVKEMTGRLEEMFREMSDLSVPFRRTEDVSVCSYCDFKMICGR